MIPPSSNPIEAPASRKIAGTLETEQVAQAGLAILSELEHSLRRSHKALVTLDGAAVERLTEEQSRLSRALAIFFPPGTPHRDEGRSRKPPAPSWQPQFYAVAARVAQLARVQAVLLRRAHSLRTVLSNFRADPGEVYGPAIFQTGSRRRAQQ